MQYPLTSFERKTTELTNVMIGTTGVDGGHQDNGCIELRHLDVEVNINRQVGSWCSRKSNDIFVTQHNWIICFTIFIYKNEALIDVMLVLRYLQTVSYRYVLSRLWEAKSFPTLWRNMEQWSEVLWSSLRVAVVLGFSTALHRSKSTVVWMHRWWGWSFWWNPNIFFLGGIQSYKAIKWKFGDLFLNGNLMVLSCWPFCPRIYEIIVTNSKANHNQYQNYIEVEIDFSRN